MLHYDIGIVGLGGFGSAAAYWATRRAGVSVIGFEQFELGHRRGASEDHSRIIRYSYHRCDYVRLASSAYQAWSRVEAEAGETLVIRTGGLDLFPEHVSPEPAPIDIETYRASMASEGVLFEQLDCDTTQARWQQFRLPPGCRVLHQKDAGVVLASRANAAHRRLAAAAGATFCERTPVDRIEARGAGFEVKVGEAAYSVRNLIITADAWTNHVLSMLGVPALNLAVTREEVGYFAPKRPEIFGPERMPVWIWMGDPSFYGFPDLGGLGVKLGQDCGGAEVSPEGRGFEPNAYYQARLETFLGELLPEAAGARLEARTCLYTMTPDHEFVIDRLPECPQAVLGLGSGHGFKFASVIGGILVDLCLDGTTSADISGFSIERPVLTMAEPPWKLLI